MEGIGPCDLVAMDIATLPWSDDKFRYFLCIVDVRFGPSEALKCDVHQPLESGLTLTRPNGMTVNSTFEYLLLMALRCYNQYDDSNSCDYIA